MADSIRQKGRYRDLDLDFIPHPVTGDIVTKTDAEAIKRSVKTLVLTRFYDRLWQPDIGSSAPDLLFENNTPITITLLQQTIENVIKNHEPRVELIEVQVTDRVDVNNREYIVNEIFNIVNRPEPIKVNFVLKRTR